MVVGAVLSKIAAERARIAISSQSNRQIMAATPSSRQFGYCDDQDFLISWSVMALDVQLADFAQSYRYFLFKTSLVRKVSRIPVLQITWFFVL